jgi:hypothetical protein
VNQEKQMQRRIASHFTRQAFASTIDERSVIPTQNQQNVDESPTTMGFVRPMPFIGTLRAPGRLRHARHAVA